MMRSRRTPRAAGPRTTKPSSSGPRWVMRLAMRSRTACSGRPSAAPARSRRCRTRALLDSLHAVRLTDVEGGLALGLVEAADHDIGEKAHEEREHAGEEIG